jgi:hypothetical protein
MTPYDDPVGRCGGGRPGAANIIIIVHRRSPDRPSSIVFDIAGKTISETSSSWRCNMVAC